MPPHSLVRSLPYRDRLRLATSRVKKYFPLGRNWGVWPTTHIATAPGQVWCWDMSYLPANVMGRWFRLYLILDLYSRKIVGAEVHDKHPDRLGWPRSRALRQAASRLQPASPDLGGRQGRRFSVAVERAIRPGAASWSRLAGGRNRPGESSASAENMPSKQRFPPQLEQLTRSNRASARAPGSGLAAVRAVLRA